MAILVGLVVVGVGLVLGLLLWALEKTDRCFVCSVC
jgi:hypothetical protein